MARHERWTAIISAGLVFGALLACKKKSTEATPDASATAPLVAPPPTPIPTAAGGIVDAGPPKLGDVKRYADKEKKADEGAVRVLEDDVKVYNEADSKTPDVASLPKDLLVFRLAEFQGFELVEFPSGIGQFSTGWVETKALSTTPEKVAREVVLKEKKTATLTDGGAPSPKSSASASAKPSASASAKPSPKASASASAAPVPTPSVKPLEPPKPPEPPAPPKPKKTTKKKAAKEK